MTSACQKNAGTDINLASALQTLSGEDNIFCQAILDDFALTIFPGNFKGHPGET